MRTGLHTDEHDSVNTGIEISPGPRQTILDTIHADRTGATEDDQVRILPAGQRGFHFANTFLERQKFGVLLRKSPGKQGVFDGQAGHTGIFQFLDGAFDVQSIAVAVIGVDDQRELSGTTNTPRLVSKF